MSTAARPTPAPKITDSDIAQRAYERWTARGCPTGDGREDWLAAEAELLAERVLQAQPAAQAEPEHPKPAAPAPGRRRPIRSALRRLGL